MKYSRTVRVDSCTNRKEEVVVHLLKKRCISRGVLSLVDVVVVVVDLKRGRPNILDSQIALICNILRIGDLSVKINYLLSKKEANLVVTERYY